MNSFNPLKSAALKVQQAESIISQSNQDFVDSVQEGNAEEYLEEGAQQLGEAISNAASSVASGIGNIAADSIEFGFSLTWDLVKPILVRYWYVIIPLIALAIYLLLKFVF